MLLQLSVRFNRTDCRLKLPQLDSVMELMWRLLFVFFECQAQAFDILPEYQGITEGDLAKFERPKDIDSEYQLIVNSYALPFEWERQWLASSRAFDLTVGSLSNKHFLNYSRAKFETELNDTLNFRFTYFSQQDFESDQVRHILELSQRITPWLRINAYGEPLLYKRQNDLGLALEVKPYENFRNRFYYTYHEALRNEHNDLPDHFAKGSWPASMGWTGVWMKSSLLVRSGFRYDQFVRWIRPQELRDFFYSKKMIFADVQFALAEKQEFLLRLQWDSTFKRSSPSDGSSAYAEESWKNDRLFANVSYKYGGDEDLFSYEPAFMIAQRTWTDKNASVVKHSNILPGLTARMRGTSRGDRFDHIQFNTEMNFFEKQDADHITSEQKSSAIEARLQAAYEFSFRSNSNLLIALNLDLDEWRTVPTFEGGNVKFRTEF
jgi:hypothetical protein